MARIRSVKPEFWEDDAIGVLSRDARLLYIATWNMADDEGLLRWSSSYLKANAFMYDDDLSNEDVTALMDELTGAGIVCTYTGGKARQSLAWIIQFHKHQKPNRPQPSKLPPPSIQSGDVLQAYIRRDGATCHLCGHETSSEHDKRGLWPSLDHLKPRSQGGSDYPSNLKISHTTCNISRRDRPVESSQGSSRIPSLIPTVNDSVNDSLPEGLRSGGEREMEREGSSAPNAARGTRIPEPFEISDEMKTWATSEGFTPAQARTSTARFVDYWRGKPGKDGRKVDWPATWRNWLRRDITPVPIRPSATDAAVSEGLALRDRYAAQEQAGITR